MGIFLRSQMLAWSAVLHGHRCPAPDWAQSAENIALHAVLLRSALVDIEVAATRDRLTAAGTRRCGSSEARSAPVRCTRGRCYCSQ